MEIQSRCFMRFMVKPYIFSEGDLIFDGPRYLSGNKPRETKVRKTRIYS